MCLCMSTLFVWSFDVVKVIDCIHEATDADSVIRDGARVSGVKLCSIENCVEFSNLVRVANLFEKCFNFISASWSLKISLRYSKLVESRWEQDINCFWLITVVLMVSDGF